MTTLHVSSSTEATQAPPVARKRSVRRKSVDAINAVDGFLDPAGQLDKLTPDAPVPTSRKRGVPAMAAAAGPAMPAGFFDAYTGAMLSAKDLADAAQVLGCEVAAVRAVAEVESRGAGFDALKRPTILYERHVFARCTVPPGTFDAAHPDLSGLHNPYPRGGYGTRDQQYGKLARALPLDRDAALKAASWGVFQILGENHKACGFTTVASFVRAMTVSDAEHLKAFVQFVRNNAKLLKAIRSRNWAAFAEGYNGRDYATFQYDQKMATAYAKYAG
ncbi:N-acetylmuramidase family protein [Sphaerotilus sp.]|uniref:N-acetylmuramidase family protein n=1 Tax=Sphaerotilus sp. TaxID=2093942 RepID=UPI00286D93B9|nr:N-acetylmuramidase family protein [Sphaerotilus sp.]